MNVQADDLRSAQASGIFKKKDRPFPQPAQIVGQGGDHHENVLGYNDFLLNRRTCVLARDPGQHRADVPVLAIDGETPRRMAPGEPQRSAVYGAFR